MHFHPIQQCGHSRNPRAGFAIIAGTGCRTPSPFHDRRMESVARITEKCLSPRRIEAICRWLSDSAFSLPAVFGQPCARHASNRLYLSFEEPLSPNDEEPGFRAFQLPLVRVARDWSARPRLSLPV
jgi:hypothetical protein